ncbi:SAM-dependent methyltransferase [Saccharothrix algeriensis]|uniref:SAM-dependent methyltransferase n=1 Tax=Saccharothrix algeriensis TaxID=173560 RepID=A0A8T8I2P1_9PSEU|nr:SAM-dependent methyltransferase [Saccharothrix algeriensis]MBM7811078.1 SAM-dependent methyltransferase [Saccharothrix algeriensis]QTR05026.1 SAM-dependent methyltransferase [Saccharothrix algeriensis]
MADDIDLTRPSAARVYDYYLGGAHNFAVDRDMALKAIELWPELPLIMQANRAFLRRAVEYCAARGVRQFLDLGSGIPTAGNVHEVAHRADPGARVVYVDNDPIAVTYSRTILGDDRRTAVVQEDLRRPERVLGHPAVRDLLDFDRPIAVMMVAVLHFVTDADRPDDLVAAYRDAVAPGSHLVVSHATRDGQDEQADSHQDLYRKRTATPMTMRSADRVRALFAGYELVEPGVVHLPLWRPASPEEVGAAPERFAGLAAVGRKP